MRVTRKDLQNPSFLEGMKLASQHKQQKTTIDINAVPDGDFKRGYIAIMSHKTPHSDSWWSKFNDKLTAAIADFGTSFFTKK